MRPIIGVSCSQDPESFELKLKADYIEAILINGGLPLVIPVITSAGLLGEALQRCQGLLLTGGGDVDPKFYDHSQPARLLARDVNPNRDCYEMGLIDFALKMKKPILAICRGTQLLNIFGGGSLIWDLATEIPNSTPHLSENSRTINHEIITIKDSWLQKILGNRINVNSFHHQAVKELGNGLIATAVSVDGVIEGIESHQKTWVVGVQWHPERMLHLPEMRKLFQEFIYQANQ